MYHLIKTDQPMGNIIAEYCHFNGWSSGQHCPTARILKHDYECLIDLRNFFVMYPHGNDLAANTLRKNKFGVPGE